MACRCQAIEGPTVSSGFDWKLVLMAISAAASVAAAIAITRLARHTVGGSGDAAGTRRL